MNTTAGSGRVALLTFLISFTVLLANGRAIGSGDTHAVERTAGALVERGTFVLPEDGALDPFTRPVPGGRVSIYPAVPAFLATPVFFIFGRFFDLNPAGLQVAGKLSAAFLAACAISLLARSFSRRTSPSLALGSALLFGLGTSVYSTAQALWQHPAVLLFLVVGVSALERVETAAGPFRLRPALEASFALSMAAVSRPAAIPMCAVLFLFLLRRMSAHKGQLVAIACLPAAFVAFYNTSAFGAPWRFGPGLTGRFMDAFPGSIAGLLISPARGLFVFTPIALLALWGLTSRARHCALARGLLCAAGAHLLFMATWNEWHGGESFGPRLLTDLLPPLFFFLPEALAAWPAQGAVLGILSVAVQLLGGWTYDYRWERLHQRGRDFDAALWSWRDSPIAFAVREGVLIQGVPEVDGRRVRLRLHRSVSFGPDGSAIEATAAGLRISGPGLLKDIRLERGARISGGWMTLAHPGDALAFRTENAGPLSLRIVGSFGGGSPPGGSLQGVLRIETRSLSTSVFVLTGDFDLPLTLQLAADDEVFVRAARGELRLARLNVVAAGVKP